MPVRSLTLPAAVAVWQIASAFPQLSAAAAVENPFLKDLHGETISEGTLAKFS
jgi:hypothetical protein